LWTTLKAKRSPSRYEQAEDLDIRKSAVSERNSSTKGFTMRRFDLFLVMLLIFAIILSSCVVRGDRESLYTSNETYSAFIHVNVIPMTQEIILDDQT